MITLIDVLHKIGFDSYRTTAKKPLDLNVCITTDVEESEADFLSKYGSGNTYYFRLESYHHGRKLAAALYQRIKGTLLDLPENIKSKYPFNKNLYFFVHVRELQEVA